jgi:signal transduction histidine kinase
MAVEEPQTTQQSTMVRDYWPRFHRNAIAMTIIMQIIGTLSVGGALILAGVATPVPRFWIALVAVLAGSIGINLILMNLLTAPLKNLASALTHISGEPSVVTPPNPNIQHFAHNGFKPLLQLIYTLAAKSKATSENEAEDAAHNIPPSNVITALNNTAAGFVVMDVKQHIQFANTQAPVHTNPDGNQVIDLVFDEQPTLEMWLKDCEEHAVRAERTWQRVANKIIGEENRKIYDIAASYQKGSDAEVVVTLFERTNMYQPEDDDLDFIAFAAHELRGPITVIRGYLDVLGDELESELNRDQTELFERLVVSANRLSSYVNNILNASRYDRRHLKIHLREDSIANIYETIEDDMRLRAASQNRLLSIHFSQDLPTVAADRASISEVLSNLIDNAIKYSNEGGSVAVTAKPEGDFVKVLVEDHGIGMPGSVVSNLFHKFYRSHRSRETVAGTGIGLYISKAIVESHGGKISVRSAEGEGSTFEFSLPVYSTVAAKISADNNSNESLIEHSEDGWIKNHAMYRG